LGRNYCTKGGRKGRLLCEIYKKSPRFFAIRPHLQPSRQMASESGWDFRQGFNSLNFRGHAKMPAEVFYPAHLSVTANPALFAGGEFRGKHHDKVNFGPFDQSGLGIKKHTVRTHVAGVSRKFGGVVSVADTHVHPLHEAVARPPLGVRIFRFRRHKRITLSTPSRLSPVDIEPQDCSAWPTLRNEKPALSTRGCYCAAYRKFR
jgi:hypothetical protein